MHPWRKVLLFLVVAVFSASTWYFLQERTIIEFPNFGSSFVQEQKLTASDGAAGDQLGISVSLSDDGTRMAIGADGDDVEGVANQGSVYIFSRSGTTWIEEQHIIGEDVGSSYWFDTVSLSGDGSRFIASSIYSGGGVVGAAYIYSRTGTTWALEQRLTASDAAVSDAFGLGMAISDDGTRVAIGAGGDDIGANSNQGSVYIFSRSGTTWTEEQKLTASDGAASDAFAPSISLSSDGSRVAIGTHLDDIAVAADQGSVYIFSRSGTTWTEEQKLTASDGLASDNFGVHISLANDASRIAIGAWKDDIGANGDQGSAYIFSRSGTTWIEEQKLTASDGAANDNFGPRVSLSSDGSRFATSATGDDIGANGNQGSAYIFSRTGTTWTQDQQLTASDGLANDTFGGYGVSIAGDGTRVVVSTAYDDVGANANQGSAYIFNLVAAAGGRRPHPEDEFTPSPTLVASTAPSAEVEPQNSPEVQPPVTPTPSPTPPSLPEGTVISVVGDPDIYVLNASGTKRLFLNPAIFRMYDHLRYENIVAVPASVRDSYTTSLLFRDCESNNLPVYVLEPTAEDRGTLHWLNISADEALSSDPAFFSKVFCINTTELNFYSRGVPYTSLGQIPPYSR